MSPSFDIATFLASEGHGTHGVNIFDGEMPNEPDLLTVTRDTTGLNNVYVQGLDEPLLEVPGVQVTTRGLTYSAAQARAWSAYRLIAKEGGGFTVNGRRYTSVTPQQPPVFLQRDDSARAPEGRAIFVFNVLFEREYPAS
jgi:hypothetical protein